MTFALDLECEGHIMFPVVDYQLLETVLEFVTF